MHQGFQSLLTEVNRTDTQYLLRTANRLFGNKSHEFLSVSHTHCFLTKKVKMPRGWGGGVMR